MSAYQDLIQVWNQLTSSLSTQKFGRGERRMFQQQRSGVRRELMNTPEFKHAFSACKAKADEMNAPYRNSNMSDQYEVFVDSRTLKCKVVISTANTDVRDQA